MHLIFPWLKILRKFEYGSTGTHRASSLPQTLTPYFIPLTKTTTFERKYKWFITRIYRDTCIQKRIIGHANSGQMICHCLLCWPTWREAFLLGIIVNQKGLTTLLSEFLRLLVIQQYLEPEILDDFWLEGEWHTEATFKSPQCVHLFRTGDSREGKSTKKKGYNNFHTSAKQRSNRPLSIFRYINILT